MKWFSKGNATFNQAMLKKAFPWSSDKDLAKVQRVSVFGTKCYGTDYGFPISRIKRV